MLAFQQHRPAAAGSNSLEPVPHRHPLLQQRGLDSNTRPWKAAGHVCCRGIEGLRRRQGQQLWHCRSSAAGGANPVNVGVPGVPGDDQTGLIHTTIAQIDQDTGGHCFLWINDEYGSQFLLCLPALAARLGFALHMDGSSPC